MSNLDLRIKHLKSKLAIARSLAPDIFGSDTHKWNLNDPISDTELQRIENIFNISFPEEYRRFISEIGNGGAGPAYGITPIEDAVKYYIKQGYFDLLEIEFPHEESFNDCDDPYLAESEQKSYRGEITEEELDRIYCYSNPGVIDICELGCSYTIKLVISGKTRGQIWRDESAADCGVSYLGVSFLNWYEEWLDSSLKGVFGK